MLLFLLACSPRFPEAQFHSSDPVVDSEEAAQALCALAQTAQSSCAQQGSTLHLGDSEVRVGMLVTQAVWLPGRSHGLGDSKRTLPGTMDLSWRIEVLDPSGAMVTAVTEGVSSGSAPDPELAYQVAREAALDRWLDLAGVALIDARSPTPAALTLLEGSPWSAQVLGMQVNRGLVRQTSQISLMEAQPTQGIALDHEALAGALEPLIPRDGRAHPVELELRFGRQETSCPGPHPLSASLRVAGELHEAGPATALCTALQEAELAPVKGTHALSVVYVYSPADLSL